MRLRVLIPLLYSATHGLLIWYRAIRYKFIALAGFWPRGQNPRRRPRIPRAYTYKDKEYLLRMKEMYIGSGRIILDLTNIGAHGGLG